MPSARSMLKLAVVIAGPNGAGKSTFYEKEISSRYVGLPFVNADRIALELGANANAYGAAEEAERRRREFMRRGLSFITETVFSHESKLKLMRDLRDAGYQVHLHGIHLDSAALAVKRVAFRVADGGHPVPEEKIRARYPRTKRLLRDAAKLAHRAWFWDNSDPDLPFRPMASVP